MPTARPLTRPTAARPDELVAEPNVVGGEAERDRDGEREEGHDGGVARAGAERGDDRADQQQLDEHGVARRPRGRPPRPAQTATSESRNTPRPSRTPPVWVCEPNRLQTTSARRLRLYTRVRMHDFDRDPDGVVRVRRPNPPRSRWTGPTPTWSALGGRSGAGRRRSTCTRCVRPRPTAIEGVVLTHGHADHAERRRPARRARCTGPATARAPGRSSAIATPGHSPDSVCLIWRRAGLLHGRHGAGQRQRVHRARGGLAVGVPGVAAAAARSWPWRCSARGTGRTCGTRRRSSTSTSPTASIASGGWSEALDAGLRTQRRAARLGLVGRPGGAALLRRPVAGLAPREAARRRGGCRRAWSASCPARDSPRTSGRPCRPLRA